MLRQSYGPREHLDTLFRHKTMILTTLMITALVAGLVSFQLSNVYQAQSRILLQHNRGQKSIRSVVTTPMFDAKEGQHDIIRTEVEIFKSPLLLIEVVKELGPEQVLQAMRWRWDWLREMPDRIKEAIFSRVRTWLTGAQTVSQESPEYAAVLKIADHLQVEPVIKTDIFEVRFISPDPEFSALVVNTLIDFYLKNNITMQYQERASHVYSNEVERLTKLVRETETNLNSFKEKWGIVSFKTQKDLLLQRVNRTEAELENKIFQLQAERNQYTKESPAARGLDANITANNNARLALTRRIKEDKKELDKLNRLEFEYNELRRDLDIKQAGLDLYLKRSQDSRASALFHSNRVSNATPIEPAFPPMIPIAPNKKLILLLGILMGLFGAIGLAYFLEYFRRTFVNPEEVESTLGLNVAATFPLGNGHPNTQADISLELRKLSGIIHKPSSKQVRSLLITSTCVSEGKSFVAEGLARQLTIQGSNVLLVDAVELVGTQMPLSPGQEPNAILNPTIETDPNEETRATGQINRKIISISEFEAIIEAINQKNFDYILIDAPSLSRSPEVLSLTSSVDGILLVILAENTSAETVLKSLKQLKESGGHVLVTVLNGYRYIIPRWLDQRFFGAPSEFAKEKNMDLAS